MNIENIENISAQGSCLCGKVTVSANKLSKNVGACHCSMCRKLSSGPFMAVNAGTDVQFTGESHIQTFASSEWADRGFCNHCGSNLFYYLKPTKQFMVSAGLFDEAFNFDHQVFIDEKPHYYDFANKTHDMTGAELFEAFNDKNKT